MKIVSISTDRKIFEEGSAVRARQIEYGTLFEEFHIIVFTKRITNYESRIKGEKISKNVWVYRTNSLSKFLYISDAIKIGRRILHDSQFTIHNSVISTQDPFETGIAGWRIAKKAGIPLHVQIHTDFLSLHFAKQSILNHIRFHIAKFLLPRADTIRVVSKRISNSLATNHYKLKTAPIVLPIWTDIKGIIDYQPKIDLHKNYPQFEKIILMMSRLEPEKGIQLAIEAFAVVIKKYPKAGLIIVGSGSLLSALKLKAKSLPRSELRSATWGYNLEANVVFEPWTDDPISYYKTADIFLNTSFYEGYGLSLVEASASLCHVISTDVGVAREIGATIVSRNPSEITEKILTLIDKPKPEHFSYTFLSKEEYLQKYKNLLE